MTSGGVFVLKEVSGEAIWERTLPDLEATEHLARIIAQELCPGDLVTLAGDLGSGKTTLARAILRSLTQNPKLDVPSPTFTIMQTYETLKGQVIHADFYRIGGPSDLIELDWDDLSEESIVLVEWPDRALSELNPNRLEVLFDFDVLSGKRTAYLLGRGTFRQRVMTMVAVENLLFKTPWGEAERIPIQGDASTREYERLELPNGPSAILMISPRIPEGPPVRRGRSYRTIAKLADTVQAFVAIDQGLIALGLSAPRIFLKDLDAGLLVLEDLGGEPVVDQDGPIPERYQEAVRVLARMHRMTLPQKLPVTTTAEYELPVYDLEAMTIEVELLLDWYIPSKRGRDISGSARSEFGHLWTDILKPVLAEPVTWTLRDYHSPNLFWLEDRNSIQKLGLIDFQDAVLGPFSYDLVSLLQDARVTVPADLELKLLAFYGRERHTFENSFDIGAFAETYAIMGAQRATKILGIFTRLDKRDGKPQYLQHISRLETYLARNLEHPALTRLKRWYVDNLPHLFENNS